MDLSVIGDAVDLQQFAAEWEQFVEQHPSSTPFHKPAWLITWWNHFGSGSLHVIVIRDYGRTCAVFPCFVLVWDGSRQLTLLGSGISDYLDPLIKPGHEEGVLSLLQEHLNGYEEWDVLDWTDISPEHPLFSLHGSERNEWIPRTDIHFSGTFESFWAARGKDLRRNARRYRERAEELGVVQFDVSESGTPQLIETLILLHTKRWTSQGKPGMIEANHSADFLAEVAMEFSCLGMARFFVLRFRGEVAAILFALIYRDRVYGYMSAFDPETAEFSLGQTLLFEAIQWAYNRYTSWDFLRGDELYKLRWGAQCHPRAKLRLERKRAALP